MPSQILKLLKVLSDASRLKLVALLAAGGERTVGELAQIMGQSQPRVSHHLRLLSEAGVVDRNPEGAFVFYRLQIYPKSHPRDPLGLISQLVGLINQQANLPDSPPPIDHLSLLSSADRRALQRIIDQQHQLATDYFDDHAEQWDAFRATQLNEERVNQEILKLLIGTNYESILDIGVGTGAMLELLAKAALVAEGIDLSRQMLAIARAKLSQKSYHHCHVRQGDMSRLPQQNDSFDLITMHQVLHFSDHPEAALAEATRVLKIGGTLLLVDFAPHQEEWLRHQHSHRHLGFSEETMHSLVKPLALRQTGFSVLSEPDRLSINMWKFAKVLV